MQRPWAFMAWCVAVLMVFGWAKQFGWDAWPLAAGAYAVATSRVAGSSSGGGGSSGFGSSSGGRSGSSSSSHK